MNAAQAKQATRTYQPLEPDHIRVLVLYPGLPGQQLKGSFELFDLRSSDPDVDYEAISYVCGPPIVAQQFYFSDGQLGIGRNLFEALERFREPDRTRKVWCDAICINQDDTLERSRQVAIMGRIPSDQEGIVAQPLLRLLLSARSIAGKSSHRGFTRCYEAYSSAIFYPSVDYPRSCRRTPCRTVLRAASLFVAGV